MKNSFKRSKDKFISKLNDNFLKFSMLLVKASKFLICKKSTKEEYFSTIRVLKKNYYNLLKKILQEFKTP